MDILKKIPQPFRKIALISMAVIGIILLAIFVSRIGKKEERITPEQFKEFCAKHLIQMKDCKVRRTPYKVVSGR